MRQKRRASVDFIVEALPQVTVAIFTRISKTAAGAPGRTVVPSDQRLNRTKVPVGY